MLQNIYNDSLIKRIPENFTFNYNIMNSILNREIKLRTNNAWFRISGIEVSNNEWEKSGKACRFFVKNNKKELKENLATTPFYQMNSNFKIDKFVIDFDEFKDLTGKVYNNISGKEMFSIFIDSKFYVYLKEKKIEPNYITITRRGLQVSWLIQPIQVRWSDWGIYNSKEGKEEKKYYKGYLKDKVKAIYQTHQNKFSIHSRELKTFHSMIGMAKGLFALVGADMCAYEDFTAFHPRIVRNPFVNPTFFNKDNEYSVSFLLKQFNSLNTVFDIKNNNKAKQTKTINNNNINSKVDRNNDNYKTINSYINNDKKTNRFITTQMLKTFSYTAIKHKDKKSLVNNYSLTSDEKKAILFAVTHKGRALPVLNPNLLKGSGFRNVLLFDYVRLTTYSYVNHLLVKKESKENILNKINKFLPTLLNALNKLFQTPLSNNELKSIEKSIFSYMYNIYIDGFGHRQNAFNKKLANNKSIVAQEKFITNYLLNQSIIYRGNIKNSSLRELAEITGVSKTTVANWKKNNLLNEVILKLFAVLIKNKPKLSQYVIALILKYSYLLKPEQIIVEIIKALLIKNTEKLKY